MSKNPNIFQRIGRFIAGKEVKDINLSDFDLPQPGDIPVASSVPESEQDSSTSPPPSLRNVNLSASNFTFNLLKGIFDGEKYPGGLDPALDFYYIDYWTLRRRSYKLFTENRYATGLIRRMLTNEIHTGLILEATPVGNILKNFDNDYLNTWADEVESKFTVWSNNKELVSYDHKRTFGQIQRDIRKTALLSGDVLIVLRQHPVTKTPVIQLIDGYNVRTPLEKADNQKIRDGVELDDKGRHIAYYVQTGDDPFNVNYERVPVKGSRSGRRIAWMVYGHKIRINDVRGMPALGIIIQALKELDRYSDAEQRSAVLNAIMALFIEKGQNVPSSKSIVGGAVRHTAVGQDDSDGTTTTRQFNVSSQLPGVILDELNYGEKPTSFTAARPNVNYRAFEEAMMASFAWVEEMPPNIYRLAYSSNYSASTGEVNEYKIYLDRKRADIASDTTKPFYAEWLLSMVLNDDIAAPGLLEAWRDQSKFLEYGAWIASEWGGAIKPSMRLIQDVKAYIAAKKEGLITYDMITKFLWGKKFTTIARRLTRENEEYIAAMQPLIDAGLLSIDPVDTNATINPEER